MSEELRAWLEGVKQREARASHMVSALCQPRGTAGSREWIMSIPARPDYDPDLVIGVSLSDLRTLIAKVEDLAEALQGLMDEQEGPPSPKRREQWEAAMAEARKTLRVIPSEETTAGRVRQSVEGEYKPRVGERVRILMGDHYDEFGTVLEPANGHGLYAIRLDSGHSIKAKPGYFERSLQAEFGNPYLTKVVRGVNRTCECGEQYELRPICATCEKRFRRQLAEAQERAERAIDKRVLALNERVKQARAMIAEERKRAELAEAHNAQLRKVLERVRDICAMSRKVSIGGINTHHAVHVRVGLVEEMTTALSSSPANPVAVVVEAARRWKAARDENAISWTVESGSELYRASEALSRAIANLPGGEEFYECPRCGGKQLGSTAAACPCSEVDIP